MKCFLLRDLLPLYVEGHISEETRVLVEEHLADCKECSELLKSITESNAELKESIKDMETPVPGTENRDIWRKYYGSLLVKGIVFFFLVFIATLDTIRAIRSISRILRP